MDRCCHSSLLHIEISAYPLFNRLFCFLQLVRKKKRHVSSMVDWSGASVTPRGFSVTGETLERTQVSEAAHQTPPGKDAGGAEINPLALLKGLFLLVT
ncbi:hypothetical protein CD31_18610 [Lysinibacillus boronitolerans JCM 21713 = 10a = NBRC 103108]|uniref:Uncharacterized protein n=1 Tax=Lysinibacillus boronitolerans JCM 21713 = 10a = NBRC 103108 TaxID=1294264 RepID=A0ABR4XVN8_9BACI|nr:hypothetical protein CD31_18610 [Lysinibacillus boronitolerans JCM 21713 = 10a = NBRC 103108]